MVATTFDDFFSWIRTYNPDGFSNEDDVESKFVEPFFEHLGYPDNCRHGKYGIRRSGKRGRPIEMDEIYFAVPGETEQNRETSLVIVEVKDIDQFNLEKALAQVSRYGIFMKPLLLIVTNGRRLQVWHCDHPEQPALDEEIIALQNEDKARQIHKILNFEIVRDVKRRILTEGIFIPFARIERALRRDPELYQQMDQEDFPSRKKCYENVLCVSRPKVEIQCLLPTGLTEGCCSIRFSSILLRRLTVHLDHKQVLNNLLRGLGTSPSARARSFIGRTFKGGFEAHLGQTTIALSELEAQDLCYCVDQIGYEYRRTIIHAENRLQSWRYDLATADYGRGLRLFTVKQWLWDYMKDFADHFDWAKGNSEWHIFSAMRTYLWVCIRDEEHTSIWPKVNSVGDIDIIYELPQQMKWLPGDIIRHDWDSNIGPNGLWTARYTDAWLRKKFIPKVLTFYRDSKRIDANSQLSGIESDYRQVYTSFNSIQNLEQLEFYLDGVQSWFHMSSSQIISAIHLRRYYAAFTDLARNAEPSMLKLGYIEDTLPKLPGYDLSNEDNNYAINVDRQLRYHAVVHRLEQHTDRIQKIEAESSWNADLISRVFAAILEDGRIKCSQTQLNAAIQSLRPLWKQYRFEERYLSY